jgi:plastocyanin
MHRLVIIIGIGVMFLLPVAASAGDLTGTTLMAGKPVPSAVVWLDVDPAPAFSQTTKVIIDQRNLSFTPQVLVVRVGTTVDFPNNDRVFHNVFSFRDGKKFDLGMYPAGTSKRIVFDQPGLARLFCNIHPNMAAYVMALDTPFYAVSNERGAFVMTGVLPGTYTYHAWRPGGQLLTGTVTLDGARPLEIQW